MLVLVTGPLARNDVICSELTSYTINRAATVTTFARPTDQGTIDAAPCAPAGECPAGTGWSGGVTDVTS